jgi:hypothetical protein
MLVPLPIFEDWLAIIDHKYPLGDVKPSHSRIISFIIPDGSDHWCAYNSHVPEYYPKASLLLSQLAGLTDMTALSWTFSSSRYHLSCDTLNDHPESGVVDKAMITAWWFQNLR